MIFPEPEIEIHEGYYHCEASNLLGIAASEVIHVTPHNVTYESWMTPPKFTTTPEMQIVEIEKDVSSLPVSS